MSKHKNIKFKKFFTLGIMLRQLSLVAIYPMNRIQVRIDDCTLRLNGVTKFFLF